MSIIVYGTTWEEQKRVLHVHSMLCDTPAKWWAATMCVYRATIDLGVWIPAGPPRSVAGPWIRGTFDA